MLPLLELADIRKSYPSGFALDGISLKLQPGEVLALVGQNGCGKSVLLRLISGLEQPDAGTVVLDGHATMAAGGRRKRLPGIACQSQEPGLFDNLTVAENVFFASLPARGRRRFVLDSGSLHRECRALFDRLGLDLEPEARLSSLGYAHRALIAALSVCVTDNRIFLLDEPTAAMGEPEREVLFRLLQELRGRGAGVVYVTHRLDELPRIASRVCVLQQGQLVADLELCDAGRARLIQLMTGKACPQRYPRTRVQVGPVRVAVRNLASGSTLHDVSFEVRSGEVVGLTGLMGSGRTRLAGCLFGQVKPDAGSIHIDHDAVLFRHPGDALLRGLAMIPEDRQENGLFHQLDVVKNMTAASLHRFRQGVGLDTGYMEELTGNYMENLGIGHGRQAAPISEYSGGNQQKVIIARWLMCLASIYIMDEPTRGIDPAARIDIYNTMNDLVTKGAALLLISSDLEELMGMCDRILVLSGGRIARTFTRETASREAIVEAASQG